MKLVQKVQQAQRRRWRVRARVAGVAQRPRLSVHFSNKHIYAQCIDDTVGQTLVALSSLSEGMGANGVKANVSGATVLGAAFGQLAHSKGITSVVFDRGPKRYHGCVKAFADAARQAGLEF
ncbi:MAG: 50S ribosomal protein L18 [Puniceicoccales bacterium]|jgi:large subunit ribosomal protein L18|nr:50S ribosomal protein L18 [Puniceicoccales bacterium]